MKNFFYKHLALIAVGNIGIRHLQDLTKIKSYLIYKKMLEEFIKFTNIIRNKKFNSCMIT